MKGRAQRPGPELFVVLGLQAFESPEKQVARQCVHSMILQ